MAAKSEVAEALRRGAADLWPGAKVVEDARAVEGIIDDLEAQAVELHPLDFYTSEEAAEYARLVAEYNARANKTDYAASQRAWEPVQRFANKINPKYADQVKAKSKELKDEANRLRRAKSQNEFKTGRPVTAKTYHGSPSPDIVEFDDTKLGSATNANSARMGHFTAGNPKTAEVYAKNEGTEGATTYPLYTHFENPLVEDWQGGDYTEKSYSEFLKRAKAGGYDGGILLNTTDGGPVDNIFVSFKPENIRSQFAAFRDPKSKNILAGSAAAALGIGALSSSDQAAAAEADEKDGIKAPEKPRLAAIAHALRAAKQRNPELEALLPVEGAANLAEKWAYGDKRSPMDYVDFTDIAAGAGKAVFVPAKALARKTAEELLKKGVKPADIWEQIGVGKMPGTDQWVEELDTSKWRAGNLVEPGNLEDAIVAPGDEFNQHLPMGGAYYAPRDLGKVQGRYDPRVNEVTLNPNLDEDEMMDTAVHEIQHGVQEKYDWPRGGSPEMFRSMSPMSSNEAMERYSNLQGEAMARQAAARRPLTAGERREIYPFDEGNFFQNTGSEIGDLTNEPMGPSFRQMQMLEKSPLWPKVVAGELDAQTAFQMLSQQANSP